MFDARQINARAFDYYSRLAKVRDYVQRNRGTAVSVGAVAEAAGMEKKYFSTFFHEKTGVCFRDWLHYERIRHAVELIETSNQTITNVAFEVGYQDLRTFERAFKRCLDMTPQAFKKGVRPS